MPAIRAGQILRTYDATQLAETFASAATGRTADFAWRDVAGGTVYWCASQGVHVLSTAFAEAYARNPSLGLLRSDGLTTGGPDTAFFANGNIYWSAATGAHVVAGQISDTYNEVDGPSSLGLPISEVRGIFGPGACIQYFQNGMIYQFYDRGVLR